MIKGIIVHRSMKAKLKDENVKTCPRENEKLIKSAVNQLLKCHRKSKEKIDGKKHVSIKKARTGGEGAWHAHIRHSTYANLEVL